MHSIYQLKINMTDKKMQNSIICCSSEIHPKYKSIDRLKWKELKKIDYENKNQIKPGWIIPEKNQHETKNAVRAF